MLQIKLLSCYAATGNHRTISNDETGCVNLRRFHVIAVATGISDVGVGQRNQLPTIGWIRQDFLVTGHRRIEHDFADRFALSADGNAAEYGSVLQSQNSGRTQQRSLIFKGRRPVDPYFRCTKAEGLCLPLVESSAIRRPAVVYSSRAKSASTPSSKFFWEGC